LFFRKLKNTFNKTKSKSFLYLTIKNLIVFCGMIGSKNLFDVSKISFFSSDQKHKCFNIPLGFTGLTVDTRKKIYPHEQFVRLILFIHNINTGKTAIFILHIQQFQ